MFCILPTCTVTDEVSLCTVGKRLRLLSATSLQGFDPALFGHGVDASLAFRRNSPARSLASASGASGSRPARFGTARRRIMYPVVVIDRDHQPQNPRTRTTCDSKMEPIDATHGVSPIVLEL